MTETQSAVATDPLSYCVGRLNFRLPKAYLPQGRAQEVFTMRAWTEAARTPVELAQLWVRTKSTVIGSKTADAEPRRVMSELDLAGVGPAVWMTDSPVYPDSRKLLAMKPAPGHALLLELPSSAGKEAAAEGILKQVAAGYVTGTPVGFCLEHGAFDLPASKYERASASFKSGAIELSLRTQTVSRPDDGQAMSASAINTPGLTVVGKADRQVAGLPGIEERVRVAEKGVKPELLFVWVFAGGASDGLKPRITLKISGPEDQASSINAAWEALLGSLQMRPPGQKK